MTRGVAALLLALLGVLGACGLSSVTTVEGLVVDVRSSSLGSVDSFTLQTDDGERLIFVLDGEVDLEHGGFPVAHLREHQLLGEPVRVTYRREGSGSDTLLLVVRLEDVVRAGG